MPSFLFNEQTPTIQPYQAPTELMLKAGMYRDAKFKEGLNNIRSKYDNLLSLQLTNPGNQQFVRDQIKTAVDQLDKYTSADLSLPENVGSISSVFDPVTNDQSVIQDMAFTRHINKQKALIEQLSIDDPDKVAPSNVYPILQAEQQYRNGSRSARPNFATFQPYHPYEKDDDGFLSKLKEDIFADPSVMTVTDPVTGKPLYIRGEREVKTIASNKIRGALNNSFDAKKLSQMQLDYQYNMANGMYTQQRAISGLNQDISSLKSDVESAKKQLGQLGFDSDDRLKLQNLISNNESRLTNLIKTRDEISVNPDATSKYFSFNKYLNDYVEQKVQQYSTRQEGQFKPFEGDINNQEFLLKTYLEDLKARYKLQAANAKAKASSAVDMETGLLDDGSYAYEPPLKKILDRINQSGNAQLDPNSTELDALLGATRDKNNRIWYDVTGGGEGDPDKTIILKDATGSIDPEGVQTLTVNGLLGDAIHKISNLDSEYFTNKARKTGSGIGYSRYLEEHPQYTTTPMADNEKTIALGQLLSKYQSDPKSINQKLVPVLENLDKQLKAQGVNSVDPTLTAKYNDFINSDKGKSLINLGVILNAKGKGRYEFVPDGSNNLVGMSNNRMGVSGYLAVTENDLERMGLSGGGKTKRLLQDGILTEVAPTIAYGEVGSKIQKTSTPTYWMSVVLPVSGNPEAVNDKMFEDGDMKNIELKERYNAKRMQSNAFRQYINNNLMGQAQLESNGSNSFKPKANSPIDTQIQTMIKSVRANPSITPEQSRAVEEEYNRLISTPQTRADLIRNLQTYIANVNSGVRVAEGRRPEQSTTATSAPPEGELNQVPELTGNWASDLRNELAYRESRGQYTALPPVDKDTGKRISSAAGRYQFLWNTHKDQIRQVTGVDSKEEFLNSPAAQETYYTWYERNHLIPAIQRVGKYNTRNLDNVQLGKLIHFRGEQGAIDYLLGKVSDKPESYNASISDYLKPLTRKS